MYKATVVAAVLLASLPAWADAISDGRNAIELHLINAGRWNAVICDARSIDDDQFVFCHPVLDRSLGGLFAVTIGEDAPVIHPVNGKAKQYMPESEISAVNGRPIPVRPWEGPAVAIPAVLSAFQN